MRFLRSNTPDDSWITHCAIPRWGYTYKRCDPDAKEDEGGDEDQGDQGHAGMAAHAGWLRLLPWRPGLLAGGALPVVRAENGAQQCPQRATP